MLDTRSLTAGRERETQGPFSFSIRRHKSKLTGRVCVCVAFLRGRVVIRLKGPTVLFSLRRGGAYTLLGNPSNTPSNTVCVCMCCSMRISLSLCPSCCCCSFPCNESIAAAKREDHAIHQEEKDEAEAGGRP